ncbi:unnamed protein product [Calicophoron daubneyi]|uniref:Uncharacterized protein n=1 Tax=Calicophoron daubneyi TaxID=300641 RepID=A0AAV2TSS1_CALDB
MRYTITRPDPSVPWGFRIQGGRDFGQPLTVAAVTPGGLVSRYGLRPGCRITTIGGDPVSYMTHQQAQQAVIRCSNELVFETDESGVQMTADSPSYHQPPAPVRPAYDSGRPQTTLNINLVKPARGPGPTKNPALYTSTVKSTNTFGGDGTSYSPSYSPSRLDTQFSLGPNRPTTDSLRSSLNAVVADRQGPSGNYVSPSPVGGSQASWLQKAKIQPQGYRSNPICQRCKREIHGPFVDAMNYCFCQEHFTCDICHNSLGDGTFAEQNGKFYCEPDFTSFVASRCAKCNCPIIGKIIKALNKTWHPNCFVCCYCKKPLEDKFHVEDSDNVLCEEHWQQLHLTECAKCHQQISEIDRFVEAFGKQFHAKCFCCAACQTPLEGKPFHSRDGKAFCVVHAHSVALYS